MMNNTVTQYKATSNTHLAKHILQPSFFQHFVFHQNVEQRGDTGDLVYTHLRPNLPASSESSPIHNTISHTPLITTTKNRWQYPNRSNSFPHWRERGRYLLKHIPYFMHCPLPHCAWRGNRADLFDSHWQQEDHRAYYVHYGRTPKRNQIETYDPWIILNQIKDGVISISEGKNQALSLVLVKSYALHKANIWKNAWGRSRKQSSSYM